MRNARVGMRVILATKLTKRNTHDHGGWIEEFRELPVGSIGKITSTRENGDIVVKFRPQKGVGPIFTEDGMLDFIFDPEVFAMEGDFIEYEVTNKTMASNGFTSDSRILYDLEGILWENMKGQGILCRSLAVEVKVSDSLFQKVPVEMLKITKLTRRQ